MIYFSLSGCPIFETMEEDLPSVSFVFFTYFNNRSTRLMFYISPSGGRLTEQQAVSELSCEIHPSFTPKCHISLFPGEVVIHALNDLHYKETDYAKTKFFEKLI